MLQMLFYPGWLLIQALALFAAFWPLVCVVAIAFAILGFQWWRLRPRPHISVVWLVMTLIPLTLILSYASVKTGGGAHPDGAGAAAASNVVLSSVTTVACAGLIAIYRSGSGARLFVTTLIVGFVPFAYCVGAVSMMAIANKWL